MRCVVAGPGRIDYPCIQSSSSRDVVRNHLGLENRLSWKTNKVEYRKT